MHVHHNFYVEYHFTIYQVYTVHHFDIIYNTSN